MTQQESYMDKIISSLSELHDRLCKIPISKKATVNNNEQPSERPSDEEKRPTKPWWARVREKLKKICKVKKEATNHASDSEDNQGESKISRRTRRYIDEDQEDLDLDIQKLQSDVGQMISALKNMTEFQTNMSKSLERIHSINVGEILHKTDSIKSRTHDLKEIRRKISALKCYIPSSLYKKSSRVLSITEYLTNDEIDDKETDIYLPGLHVWEGFINSEAFEEVVEKFESLDFPQKLCLLSFAVFPENREVERTMLMYWWIGEGFINCDDSEKSVTRILDDFSTKRLLEPVEDERKLIPSRYRMEPHVHSAVIYLANHVYLFELYSPKGKLIMKKSVKGKVCLVKGSSLLLRKAKASVMKPQSLTTVFNSSERYPDFTFKWFPLMNSLRVLYLGRWERDAERHIEVINPEFLKDMKALKNLRLASFQGISGIENIKNSICELKNLVILDLRACYDLQVLPGDIGLLEKLVYLDASECLKLDHMPKGIAKLSSLQVLKGFVISQSDDEENCAVKHLVNLRKLSITVKNYTFKVENLIESLRSLKRLESLKIAWRGKKRPEDDRRGDESNKTEVIEEKADLEEAEKSISGKVIEGDAKTSPPQESKDTIQKKPKDHKEISKVQEKGDGEKVQENSAIDNSISHSSLKKLKLEAYPDKIPPSWLNPEDLHNLEKLCIEGGELSRISNEPSTAEFKWPVKILRLKYLHEFIVEWTDLQALFPQMIILEKYQCPKVTFCPTDGNGVWKRSQPRMMMESKGYSLARSHSDSDRQKARKVLCMCILCK